MTAKKNRDFWTETLPDYALEYGIYLFAVFLFTSKGESFRSFGLYILPVVLIIKMSLAGKLPFDWRNPLFLSIMAICTSGILSSLLSEDLSLSLYAFRKTYLKIFLIFVVISSTFNESGRLKRLLIFLSLLTAFFAAMAFYTYVTKAVLARGEIIYYSARKYNSILAYLLPFVPFTIVAAKNNIHKILLLLLLIVGLIALILTGFRGGWLSIFISMSIWFMWMLRNISPRSLILPIGLIAISIAIALTFLPSSHIPKRIKEGFSTSGRYEWRWKAYIEIYRDFPIINKLWGKGLDKKIMYNTYSEWYKLKTGNHPDPDNKAFPRNPHNHYLLVLFQQGIFGIALFMSLIFINLRALVKTIRHNAFFEHKAMGIALMGAFVGEHIIRGLTDDIWILPFGFLLGLIGAYHLSLNKPIETKPAGHSN